MSIAVESRIANVVVFLGNFSGSRVVGFILCPLIADSTGSDMIVPRKRLENSLRVHDDVNVSGRSAIRDTDRLISLVLKDRKSTRLNSSHLVISYAVFC